MAGKDELRAFEHSQKEKCNNESSDNKDMITRLKDFVDFLENRIDSEYDKLPISNDDAIRKNAYCLALEQDKNAILNILRGHDFNYIED